MTRERTPMMQETCFPDTGKVHAKGTGATGNLQILRQSSDDTRIRGWYEVSCEALRRDLFVAERR